MLGVFPKGSSYLTIKLLTFNTVILTKPKLESVSAPCFLVGNGGMDPYDGPF